VEIVTDQWHSALRMLLRGGHVAAASDLPRLLSDAVRPMGIETVIYLADVEQRMLRALPGTGEPLREPMSIDGSLAGRAFVTVTPLLAGGKPARIWMPLVDGTERLGVVDVGLPDGLAADSDTIGHITDLAGLVGHLVVAKKQYGDTLGRGRRSQPMSAAAETLWRLLPPLTFTADRVVLSAILEPCYKVGGDAFDYAIDDGVARVAIFDAVGHGLRAALTAAVALGASRTARIQGRDLSAIARAADDAIMAEYDDARFVTAVLAELDLQTGMLRYINAGHPPPVLLRNGKVVANLDRGRRMPLGLDDATGDVGQVSLEPEDRLLFYTDGFTEARDADGEQFGLDRLIEAAERHAAGDLPLPEMLRRLAHHLVDHQHGELADDASLLILSWQSPPDGRQTLP